jgi:TolB-like protein
VIWRLSQFAAGSGERTTIELRTFGRVDLRDREGSELRAVVAQPKRLALLAYLAIAHNGGFCRRDTVLAMFWPELNEEHARGALRQAVRFLRKSLGTDIVRGRGEAELGVCNVSLSCDVVAFEAACSKGDFAQALELYRGDFLDGFFASGAPGFERWVDSKRQELRWSAVRGASMLAEQGQKAGEFAAAAEWARRASALAPYDEATVRRVISLLSQLGDRTAAIRAYDELSRRLAEEFEVEPSPETKALVDAVRFGGSRGVAEAEDAPLARHSVQGKYGTERSAEHQMRSIAVLPFAVVGEDPEARYLGDGMAEDIMTALTRLPGLRVASRGAAFAVRERQPDLKAIRDLLGVDVVLEGTIRSAEKTLRVSARLTDANAGHLLWAETYERSFTDVFIVQDQIARSIVSALKITLTLGEHDSLVTRYTDDLEAYNLYLKGRYHWNKRPRETVRGLQYFQLAIERDPRFALAHAGIADCFATLGSWEAAALAPREAFPKGEAAARTALEIEPDLPEARISLGYIASHYRWRWGEASEHFGVALARKPSYGHGHHWHAHHLLATGKIEEALAASKRSRALDPLDLIINVHFAWHYWLVRRYDESIEEAKRTSELDAHEHWVPYFLGLAYGHKDLYGEAIIQHRTAVERSGGSSVMLAALGHTYATAGKRTEARRVLEQLKQLSTEKHVSSYEIAVIHAGLDETDEAFSWLEKAYEQRSAWLPYSGMDPRLDPLRPDARFADLRKKVNDEPAIVPDKFRTPHRVHEV